MTEMPGSADESTLASAQTDQRTDDSEYYLGELAKALELLADLDKINAKIAEKTARPELTISSPAKMIGIDWENHDPKRVLDNFAPELVVTREVISESTGPEADNGVGKITPDEYVEQYGGRGMESFDFAREKGLKHQIKTFAFSHLSRPAFVRMWIVFPELTNRILKVVEKDSTGVEVQVAYEIMSRLVDENDQLVKKSDGGIDDRYLTR